MILPPGARGRYSTRAALSASLARLAPALIADRSLVEPGPCNLTLPSLQLSLASLASLASRRSRVGRLSRVSRLWL